MKKHTCKLCFRGFANGLALGGHMRSHVVAAPNNKERAQIHKVIFSSSSPSASFSSTSEEDKGYELRENPKKSCRLVDPEFSSAAASSYALLHDRGESETESSRAPTHRRRSKRARLAPAPATPEPVSSVSDASPVEDVAISLMMLSRDTWKKNKESEEHEGYYVDDEDEEEEEDDDDDNDHYDQQVQLVEEKEEKELHVINKLRRKYECKTCKKAFRSYQALGGHRASHKKFKSCAPPSTNSSLPAAAARIYDVVEPAEANAEKVVHECPICFRVFTSGQALGGHKRSHLAPSAATITITPPPPPPSTASFVPVSKLGDALIDLNLPAPMEDDADRLSVVSNELNWITKR